MMFATLLLGAAIALSIIYMLRMFYAPLNRIPGPTGSLVFGNMHQLDVTPTPFVTLADWAKKYNGLFKMRLFSKYVVVVSDPKLIHVLLGSKSREFSGRPSTYRNFLYSEGDSAMSFNDAGPVHKTHKKVVATFMKKWGRGSQKMKSITQEAINDMLERLDQTRGSAVDIGDEIYHCLLDVFGILLFGEKIHLSDIEKIQRLGVIESEAFEHGGSGELLDVFPWLRYFGNRQYKAFMESRKLSYEIVNGWLEKRPKEGLIEFFQSMSDEEQERNLIHLLRNQVHMIWEVLQAGSFTSMATMTTLMNVLAHRLDIQQKLKEEIENNIGNSRPPTFEDRGKLPYLQATLLEIGRFGSLVPVSVPHKTIIDVELGGYLIPQNTEVWCNLWALHHDENIWDEPLVFKPERFLDNTLGEIVPVEHPNRRNLLPFSAGHRACVGEDFAMEEMFMMLANLIQRYTILPETTLDEQPSMDPRHMSLGDVSMPPPFKVRITEQCQK